MADFRFAEDHYLETDYGYTEDLRIESPLPIALDVIAHYKMALKIFLTIVCLFISNLILYGQQNLDSSKCILSTEFFETREIYKFVDSMPAYPGGFDSLMRFIYLNIKLPEESGGMAGKIIIQFIVESNGDIVNKKVLRGFSERVNNAILDVFDKMPLWFPGKCEGKIVPVVFILPITITLQ